MKHLAFQIGDLFQIRTKGKDGKPDEVRVCRKVSRIGFTYLDEGILGEVQFDPDIDAKIEPIPSIAPAAPAPAPEATVAAPTAPVAKKSVKKAAKMAAKKKVKKASKKH